MNLFINLILVISYLAQVDAQCSSWATQQNQASPSGNYQGGKTLAECQAICLFTGCQYGFDYIESTKQCWISTTSTLSYNFNVQHWTCSGSNPGTPSNCQPTYTVSYNKHFTGGTQNSETTLDGCQRSCTNLANCVGIDFNIGTSPFQCWILTQITPLTDQSGVNHYDKNTQSCSSPSVAPKCQTFYTVTYNKQIIGGTQNSETTLEGCQRSCTNQASCVGIDFNVLTSPYQCWILTQRTTLNDRNGVNHYDKIAQDCSPSTPNTPTCQPSYTVSYNKHFTGGTQNSETTLDGCQRSCTNLANCVGIDFNIGTSPFQCWILTQITPLNDQSGVNHYDKNTQACNTPGSVPQYPIYTLTRDMKVNGGSKTSTTWLEACKVECVNTATCIGFDFNRAVTPNECWLHYTIGNLISNPGVDHYDLTRNSVRPFIEGNSSNCIVYTNTSALGLTVQPNISSIDECTNFCIQAPKCTFGSIWNSLAALGQQCSYAMKYYLYVTIGFTYFECSTNGVEVVANVTSQFLGNPTGALTSAECGGVCSSNVNGAVWSNQDSKCYPVLPNVRTSLYGHTLTSCKN